MSIDSGELRIGNWVMPDNEKKFVPEYNNKSLKIDIDEFHEIYFHPEDYKPIELTPSILEQCGFEFKEMMFANTPMRYWRKDWFILFKVDESGKFYMPLFNDKETELDVSISHLHQLQNIFFAISNQEIEVNLT